MRQGVHAVYVSLSHPVVASSEVAAYAARRREHVLPVLAEQPGYGGSLLLRPRDSVGQLRLAQLESWAEPEDWRRWVDSSAAEGAGGDDRRLYQRRDDVSLVVADTHAAAMCSIGLHRAEPGRGEDYMARRRELANPGMGEAQGFVAVSVYVDPDDGDRFLVLFQWESDAAADGFYDTPDHRTRVVDAIREVLAHEPGSQRYDVLLRDPKGWS